MSLYVIADLHLSSDRSKSMEVFGARWKDHMEKLRNGWNSVVTPEDTVVLPGDISWSLRLEDSVDDFRYLHELNGIKLDASNDDVYRLGMAVADGSADNAAVLKWIHEHKI